MRLVNLNVMKILGLEIFLVCKWLAKWVFLVLNPILNTTICSSFVLMQCH